MFRIILRALMRLSSILWLVIVGKEKAPAKTVHCDTCHNPSDIKTTSIVCGGICICQICAQKILTLHTITNPIKSLCPHCYTSNTPTASCDYCDIPDKLIADETENETG